MKVRTTNLNMKALFISFAMMTVFATGAFATDNDDIGVRVKQSFKKEFGAAQLLYWGEAGDYLKATFILAGHRAEAYFAQDGEFLGSIRDLFFDQLPLSVMTAVDKRFPNASILNVNEVNNADGNSYFVALEYESKKFRIKTDGSGNVLQADRLKN